VSDSFILVPLGSNENSRAVLDLARRVAYRQGATVVILHVSQPCLSPLDLQNRLGLSERDINLCTIECAEGTDVAGEIVAAAERIRARFVVLHAGKAEGKVSDITLSVICRITCPAIVVRPDLGLKPDAEGRWLRRILVPLDSTPGSAEAVLRAAELARRENASLDILHIASPRDTPPSEPGSLPVGLYMDQPHYDLKSWSREFMRRFGQISVGAQISEPTPMLHLASGDPAEEIIKYADRTGADLIVSAWQGSIDEGRAKVVRELLARANCQLLFLVIGRTSQPEPANLGRTTAA
jgi:nucleotide-binding universal stress UspA family protein